MRQYRLGRLVTCCPRRAHNIKERQLYLGRVLCLGCPGGARYPILGLVALWCRRRFPGACVGNVSDAILYRWLIEVSWIMGDCNWELLYQCNPSLICGKFYQHDGYDSSKIGRCQQILYLPSLWWSRSSSLGSSKGVPHVPCQLILRQSRLSVKKTGLDATCDTRGPALWRLHNSQISQSGCVIGRLQVVQIEGGRSIRGEFRNISNHVGWLCWGRINQWVLELCMTTWCEHIRIDPSGFVDRSFLNRTRQSAHCNKTKRC